MGIRWESVWIPVTPQYRTQSKRSVIRESSAEADQDKMGDSGLARALSRFKDPVNELLGLIADEEKAKLRRWEDEKPALQVG